VTYKVNLPIFEGPLDLLLYLIKKEEIDIYDIPITKITDQYLEYIEMMKMLDLNIAGEFLVMAATLIHIKSRMLLPQETMEEEQIELDPRAELVKRLIEYKKFKEAASALNDLERGQKEVFTHGGGIDFSTMTAPAADDGFEANIFDLITAFVKIVKDFSKEDFHKIVSDEFTVGQKIHDLYHILVNRPIILFTELFKQAKNRLEAITTFLALLELIRLNEVKVVQSDTFGEIQIVRNTDIIKPPDTDEITKKISAYGGEKQENADASAGENAADRDGKSTEGTAAVADTGDGNAADMDSTGIAGDKEEINNTNEINEPVEISETPAEGQNTDDAGQNKINNTEA